jgi:putative inorganic carbon (hco3(-)) transporter
MSSLRQRSMFYNLASNKLFIIFSVIILVAFLGLAMAYQSLFAIASVALLISILAVFLWPNVVTLLVIFLIYSNAAVVAVKFHGVPYSVGSGVPALLLIPLISYVVFHKQKIVIGPVFILLLVYLAIQFVSTLFSEYKMEAINEIVTYLVEGILLYFLLVNAIRTPKMLRMVIWTLLLAGILLGGVPLFQQITGTFDNNYGGFGQVTDVGFRTEASTLLEDVRQPRLAGAIGEKNFYAQTMLILIPLGLSRFWGERNFILRILALFATAISAIGMVLAFSRGGAVGLALLILIMVFLRLIKPFQLVVFLLLTVFLLAAFPQYSRRLLSLSTITGLFSDSGETTAVDTSFRGRATEMLAAAHAFADHPIVGVGPGIFRYYSAEYGNQLGLSMLFGNREAHSLYLGIAADLGIPGILCFLYILYLTLRNLWRTQKRWKEKYPDLSNIAESFVLSIIGFMTTGIFLHLSYLRYFMMLLALANVTTLIEVREDDGSPVHQALDDRNFSLEKVSHEGS